MHVSLSDQDLQSVFGRRANFIDDFREKDFLLQEIVRVANAKNLGTRLIRGAVVLDMPGGVTIQAPLTSVEALASTFQAVQAFKA